MNKYLLFSCILFFSCSDKQKTVSNDHTNVVKYATGFQLLSDGNEYTTVRVTQPWPGSTDTLVYKPASFNRIVCTSTTHLHFLELLDRKESLAGFPNTTYIYSGFFKEQVRKGLIKDIGQENSINLELLISLEPDAVFAFDTGRESTMLDKIRELGIFVVYVPDFLELTPLGRAEWIRFFGALLGRQEMADSIFRQIETDYLELKEMAKGLEIDHRTTVMSGALYGDHWFLPAGKNWGAAFIKDARGHYLWEDNEQYGWLELSFESVYEKAHNADIWIGTSTYARLGELVAQDSRYKNFSAYKNKRIFNYSKRRNEHGGNDYFESAYARPDLVLKDIIHILHPHVFPDYETIYFEQL